MKRLAYALIGIVLLVAFLVMAQESTLGLSEADYSLLSAANSAEMSRPEGTSHTLAV